LNAMFRKVVTVDDVLASRVVCEPLHLWMLCSPNEGAAALVLQRGDGGVQRASARLRSHLPGSVLGEATPLSGVDNTDITPPSTLAATDAFGGARLGPGALRAPRRTRRGGSASARLSAPLSSARTPTRPASCSPTRSSACASPASRQS